MWASSVSRFHIGAWLLWLAAAMFAALTTRNPLYLALVILVGTGVNAWLHRAPRPGDFQIGGAGAPSNPGGQDAARRGRGLLLRAMLLMTVAAALLRGISLHIGVTVLFRLPEGLPVIGGPVTLESVVWSATEALSLLAVLAVFAAFSAGADYYALLRSLPPFLHQVGLITSIAITFIPQTVTRFSEVREAQALRGHKVRRVADLVPLVVPMLSGGMERSINLAEAMEARGFSRGPASAAQRGIRPVTAQSGLAGGLGLTLAGGALLALLPQGAWLGWAAIAAGGGLIALTLRAMGRGVKRSRYRRAIWRRADTALAAVSVGVLAFLLTYRLLAPSALVYYPFPRLHAPRFDPVVALAIAGLAVPIIVEIARERVTRKTALHHGQRDQPWQRQAHADPARRAGAADPTTHPGHVRD